MEFTIYHTLLTLYIISTIRNCCRLSKSLANNSKVNISVLYCYCVLLCMTYAAGFATPSSREKSPSTFPSRRPYLQCYIIHENYTTLEKLRHTASCPTSSTPRLHTSIRGCTYIHAYMHRCSSLHVHIYVFISHKCVLYGNNATRRHESLSIILVTPVAG